MNNINIISNFTNYQYDRTKDPAWTAPLAVNVALLIFALWVLISLIHHGIKTGKWKNIKTNKDEKLNKGIVYTLVIVTAVFCFLRLFFSLVCMNVGFSPDENLVCAVLVEILAVTYTFNIFSAMVFLWLRQRIFYSNRLLGESYSKFTKILSLASILIIFFGGLVGFLVNRILTYRLTSSFGCWVVFPSEGIVLQLILIFCLTTFGQCTLLGLFVYALRKSSQDKVSKASPCKSKRSVKLVLRRTFIIAVLSIVTDAMVPWSALVWDVPRAVTSIYNANAFLNMILVIFSFANFKQLIFSPCINYVHKKRSRL